MTPEVCLLATLNFNWVSFRATIDTVLKLRPDTAINRVPIDISNDCKILLNIAAYYGWSLNDTLSILRNPPSIFMKFITYQFFIACDQATYQELNLSSGITTIKQNLETGDSILIIATGTLADWHQTITTNLGCNLALSKEARTVFCLLMLTLEKERGLKLLFDGYRVKVLKDKTFLLEKK